MPGRKYSLTNAYRYGFNGKENDNDVKGFEGTSLDFGARIYDPRVGRWLSLDPLQAKYPELSPYNFVNNNPLFYVDPSGEEFVHYIITIKRDGSIDVKVDQVMGQWADGATIEVRYEGGNSVQEYDFTHYGSLGHNNGKNFGTGNNLNQMWTFVKELAVDPEGTLRSGKYITRQQMQEEDLKYLATLLIARKLLKEKVSSANKSNKQHAASNNGVDKKGQKKNVKTNAKIKPNTQFGIGKREIIVDENLSPELLKKLESAGYSTKRFADGTLDEEIIEYAKQNNSIVLTANVQDFTNKGITVFGVNASLATKESMPKVVNAIKTIDRNSSTHYYPIENTVPLEKEMIQH